jgi:hypothetical protein
MGAGGAVAIVLIKERHVAEAFERAGATSAENARSPEELSIGAHGIGWRRLTRRAIVREASPGRFYLDVPSWQAMRKLRRQRSLGMIVLVLALVAFILWRQSHP